MANVLILGGAGFIGVNIVKRLLSIGNKIWVYERQGANISMFDTSRYPNLFIQSGNLCDINNFAYFLDENEIEIVIHLASSLIPSSEFVDYERELSEVVFPTIKLLPLLSQRNIKLVFFSSGGTVYGNSECMHPIKETDLTEPICYYGQSKLIIEQMIKLEHKYSSLNYLIVRPSNPYGLGQNIYGQQGLIAIAIGKMLKNEPLMIWGDGTSVRDYIYVDDLVKAVCNLIDLDSTGVFNIGSGLGYSVNQVLCIINEITSNSLKIEYVDKRTVDVSSLILDISRLREEIDYTLTDLYEGVSLFLSNSINGKTVW